MSKLKIRYVWLNTKTCEFSDSWSEKDHEMLEINSEKDSEWKLIKYEEFEFNRLMRIS